MNDQNWSQPFESQETASAVKLFQPLGNDWAIKASRSVQSIKTDDRLAFPDGCYREGVYPGFCVNGDADLYDYRSLNERRLSQASSIQLEGKMSTGGLSHQVLLGFRANRLSEQLEPTQAYNFVGETNYFRSVMWPADPAATYLNRDRFLATKEWSFQDRIGWGGPMVLWAGARHTVIRGDSRLSDGSEATAFEQAFTSPFAAISYETQGFQHAYLSYAEGVETEVVPNRPIYANAGALLAAQRSRQWEAGFRKPWLSHGGLQGLLGITLFRIDRPSPADVKVGADGADGSLQRLPAAIVARHQGIELQANLSASNWGQFQWAAQRLDAETLKSLIEGQEGAPPQARAGAAVINVAPWTMHLLHRWPIANPDWQWQNRIYAVGSKPVLLASGSDQDPALSLPARWQWDSALHWQQKLARMRLRWTVAVSNLLNHADWREAPTQSWGGTYLFPVQPRSFRFAVQAHW
jgi:iron complex outermembrane receptor protein